MQSSDIITAQILDVLWLLLDLRMLSKKKRKRKMNFIFEIQRQMWCTNKCSTFLTQLQPFRLGLNCPWTQDVAAKILHLQGQAVVCGGFVFAAVVLAIVDVNMVQLQKAHQISGCLRRRHTAMNCSCSSVQGWKLTCGPQFQNKMRNYNFSGGSLTKLTTWKTQV